ncbi:endonuclease/exonuclease/phosphatase family protein [Prosthecobacter sp.]|uniref:endonuclease/exonuclease/phosphatase family protein n=1 Tax=Prosthecobacter sp. TaxID=1965333 RepID=UPI003784A8BA
MQNLWWLIFSLLILCQASGQDVVRVVTWNLEWFPGKKPAASQEERDKHFNEVADVLPKIHADVVILQEVRNDEAAQRLAKLMPGFSVHVTSRFPDSFTHKLGEQQITILSRFKADAAWSESWKRGWANAPRGYAYAKLLISGKPLHVYGLHLKSNLGNPVENTSKREDAMEQLIEHTNEYCKPGEGVVVAGDFNTSKDQVKLASDTTLLKIEKAGFFWTFEGLPLEQRITVPRKGSYPDACFDHIYVRDLGRPVAKPLTNTPGSDHFPVVLDLVVETK